MPRIKRGEASNLGLKQRLRSEMTEPEKRLWFRLRSRQLRSLKFHRQHGIGPYIVDFYCPDKGVIIEVDGDTHAAGQQRVRDVQRDRYLRALGLRIIRYTNQEIMRNLEGVLEDLCGKISAGSTSPGPSLQRRGECATSPGPFLRQAQDRLSQRKGEPSTSLRQSPFQGEGEMDR